MTGEPTPSLTNPVGKLNAFLKALETEGGKVCVIIGMLIFIVMAAMIVVLAGHPLQETGKEMCTGAVSSLLGILYGYLKAGSK